MNTTVPFYSSNLSLSDESFQDKFIDAATLFPVQTYYQPCWREQLRGRWTAEEREARGSFRVTPSGLLSDITCQFKAGSQSPQVLTLQRSPMPTRGRGASNSDKSQTQREARRLSQGVGAHTQGEDGDRHQGTNTSFGRRWRAPRKGEGRGRAWGDGLPPDTSADSLSTGMETRMGLERMWPVAKGTSR